MWSKGNTTTDGQANLYNMEISVAHPQEDSNWFISLWGIYSKDTSSYPRDTCSIMFIAILFIIVRHWKKTFCPPADEWEKKIWYVYTMEFVRKLMEVEKYHTFR